MKESLSALLDGECSPSELDRLLSELERDPELREHFSRQCLARESRMGTRIRAARLDFSSRVLAALHTKPEGSAVVIPMGSRLRRLPWRTLAGLAAAAAMGAVAVLAVRPEAGSGIPGSQSAALSPDAVMPVSREPVARGFAELDDENARQLRNYLMAYSQSRGQQGVGSTLGYARYSAYTDSDRSDPQAQEQKR
jgi:hypothetical protein